MDSLIDAFKRDADGGWICIRDVTLEGPGGRIQVTEGTRLRRGTAYMGVDLVGFLDARRAQRRNET